MLTCAGRTEILKVKQPGFCVHTANQARQSKLQLTNGYYLHFDQMTRLMRYVQEHPETVRFTRAGLAQGTGLTARQAENLASVMARMGLLRPGTYRLTEMGALVVRHDGFFDDAGTLWLCHYHLASDLQVLVWNHMANCVLPGGQPVTAPEARDSFQPFLTGFTTRSANKKLLDELRAFFNAYTEQAFRRLQYLRQTDGSAYTLTDWPAPVPPGAFLATLLFYRDRFQPGASGLEIPTICATDCSPGRLLHLGEGRVRTLLNDLHEADRLTIEAKANLDQVRFRPGQTWLEAMQAYYEER
jgi:hypothetical protein